MNAVSAPYLNAIFEDDNGYYINLGDFFVHKKDVLSSEYPYTKPIISLKIGGKHVTSFNKELISFLVERYIKKYPCWGSVSLFLEDWWDWSEVFCGISELSEEQLSLKLSKFISDVASEVLSKKVTIDVMCKYVPQHEFAEFKGYLPKDFKFKSDLSGDILCRLYRGNVELSYKDGVVVEVGAPKNNCSYDYKELYIRSRSPRQRDFAVGGARGKALVHVEFSGDDFILPSIKDGKSAILFETELHGIAKNIYSLCAGYYKRDYFELRHIHLDKLKKVFFDVSYSHPNFLIKTKDVIALKFDDMVVIFDRPGNNKDIEVDLKIGYSYSKVCILSNNVRIRNLEIVDDGYPIDKDAIVRLLTGRPVRKDKDYNREFKDYYAYSFPERVLGKINAPFEITKNFFTFKGDNRKYILYKTKPLKVTKSMVEDESISFHTARPLIFAPDIVELPYELDTRSILCGKMEKDFSMAIHPSFMDFFDYRTSPAVCCERTTFESKCDNCSLPTVLMFGKLNGTCEKLPRWLVRNSQQYITVESNVEFKKYINEYCLQLGKRDNGLYIPDSLYNEVYKNWYETGSLSIDFIKNLKGENGLKAVEFKSPEVGVFSLSEYQVRQLSSVTLSIRTLLKALERTDLKWNTWTLGEKKGIIYLCSTPKVGYAINGNNRITANGFTPFNGELQKVQEFINKTIELLLKLPFPVKSITFPLDDPTEGTMVGSSSEQGSMEIVLK